MAMPKRKPVAVVVGREQPRLAPPVPARSMVEHFDATAKQVDISLFPWQKLTARYLTGLGKDDRWLFPEVCAIVARQNGKTTLLVPLIVSRLLMGLRIMHAAQNREIPREVFGQVADVMMTHFRDRLKSKPRTANGQEQIRTKDGGLYRIAAATRDGARGPSNDLVIVDELRTLKTFEFIAAAKPTLAASQNPQIVYISNAGDSESVVLNAISLRAQTDPTLAYIEWSAAPERSADDIDGWLESNPSVGHIPHLLDYLEREYQTNKLQGTLAIFETEHLCRAVATMRERLVPDLAWAALNEPALEDAHRPAMAVSMSPDGSRASAAIAWMREDFTVGLRLLVEATGEPIDTAVMGDELRKQALALGIRRVGYDPLTDAELAKYFKKPEPISGQKFANASAQFVNLVTAKHLRWTDADAVSDDLTWTSRKLDKETGTFQAVRAQDDRSITASLAAIRAVWLASGPKPSLPRIG